MDYKKIAKAFVIQSIVLVIILCLCCSIASMVWGYDLSTDKMVSTLFVLIVDISSALIWRRHVAHVLYGCIGIPLPVGADCAGRVVFRC